MTRLARWILFFAAYAPLTALMTVRLWDTWRCGAYASIAVTIVLVIAAGLLFRLFRRGNEAAFSITHAERLSDTAPNFLLGYVLPFLLLDLSDILAVTAAFLFVLLLGWVYVHGGMLYANPLLAIFGFHVWRVEGIQTPGTGAMTSIVLLTRLRNLQPGDVVRTQGEEESIFVATPMPPALAQDGAPK